MRWKNKTVNIPKNIKIVHDELFEEAAFENYSDKKYFRIYHGLKNIDIAENDRFALRTVTEGDFEIVINIINKSYEDIRMSAEQLHRMTQSPAYRADLWQLAYEKKTGNPVGCIIADFDKEAKEGILEWVQVLPEYRRQGAAAYMVTRVLKELSEVADFATVSGEVENKTHPEALYRSCGFTGNDVWHVLKELKLTVNKEMQELVKKELESRRMLMDECRVRQLERILFELVELEENPSLALSYTRLIVDQWEYENPLTDKLLEYAENVKRMQSR